MAHDPEKNSLGKDTPLSESRSSAVQNEKKTFPALQRPYKGVPKHPIFAVFGKGRIKILRSLIKICIVTIANLLCFGV